MESHIRITTIFGIVTSFFSVYSMVAPNGHIFELGDLKYVNPLLDMNRLTVMPLTGGHNIPDDDQFFTQSDLALKLTTIKFFEESDRMKNKETLKTICDAVSNGVPVTSRHFIRPNIKKIAIMIDPCQNSTSVFMSIEDWLKYEFFTDKGKKDGLKVAIFQGERRRKERLKYICGELEENKIPKDLEHTFLSYLPEYDVSEERTELIERAEEKFHEEKQSQFSLFKMSAYLEKTVKNITDFE